MPATDAELKYNPVTDIPDQSEKVFLITGGTSGIGKTFILQLLPHNPSQIIFTGRSISRAQQVIQECKTISNQVKVSFIPCDQSDLESVKQCAKEVIGLTDRLDVLVLNAGVLVPPNGLTKQGYEIIFGTNHVSHAALTHLLLPLLIQTSKTSPSPPRIITVSSEALNILAQGIFFPQLKTTQRWTWWFLNGFRRYAQSKLANRLYSLEMSRHYPSIISVALHPGIVTTEMNSTSPWFERFLVGLQPESEKLSPNQGAWNMLWAATTPAEKEKEELQGGWFTVKPVGTIGKTIVKKHLDLSKELWEWTEKELKLNGVI